MKKKTLWRKAFNTYLILILVTILIFGISVSVYLQSFYLSSIKSHLVSTSKVFSRSLSPYFSGPSQMKRIDSFCKSLASSERFTVIAPDGKVLGDSVESVVSMENHAHRPEVREALSGQVGYSIRFSRTLNKDMMYVAFPVRKNGKFVAVARLSLPLSKIYGGLHHLWLIILITAVVSILFSISLSLVLVRKVTVPIREIRRITGRMASGELDKKIRIRTGDELEKLSTDLNKMAEQLSKRIEQIEKEKARSTTMLSNLADGVIVTNEAGEIVILNAAAQEIFGETEATAKGRTVLETTGNFKLHEAIEVSCKGQRSEGEVVFPSSSRGDRVINVKAVPVLNEEGEVFCVVTTLSDVTTDRELETLRQEFVANVSHELRTPVTNIKALSETLNDGGLEDERIGKRFISRIYEENERLTSLIDDILVLSSLEIGAKKKVELVDVGKVIEEALESFEIRASRHSISLEKSIPEDHMELLADREGLTTILANLIDNAIKYSNPGGRVVVEAEKCSEGFSISVRDFGIGIPLEDQQRIFERFYRVGKDRSRKTGGTGLGLSIVKHVVQNLNGRVGVDSSPGAGSKFTVYLPV